MDLHFNGSIFKFLSQFLLCLDTIYVPNFPNLNIKKYVGCYFEGINIDNEESTHSNIKRAGQIRDLQQCKTKIIIFFFLL
jgi:hypothetical protein